MGRCCARTIAVVALLLTFFLSVSMYVVPALASEPTLTDILNYLGYTNVANSTVETFPPGTYNITIYAEFSPYYLENVLSFYQVGTGIFTTIFNGSEGGSGYFSPITKTFGTDYQFGLSLARSNDLEFTYFTESSRNPNATKYAIIYTNLNSPSMFLIGFDDRAFCTGKGDFDYNDMVFSLQLENYLHVVSPYDSPSGEGWYYNGTNAYASLANGSFDYGNGTRTAFAQWSGDASGTNYQESDAIIMNQNKTAIANWKTQNYLTVRTSPLGIATIPGEGWYDQGQTAALTAPSVSGYVFSYWDKDNVSLGNGVNPVTITMDAPHAATAHYAKAYNLVIETTPGGSTSPQPGTYTFAENSTATVTANPSTNYVFDHWELDGVNVGSTNPYTLLMNADHTLKAVFKYSPPPPLTVSISPLSATLIIGQTVTFSSTVSGGIKPYAYQWYLDGTAVPSANSDGWTFKATSEGIHYVYLQVTDSLNQTARSETARIVVTSIPVGGYTEYLPPSRRQTVAPYSLACYVALVALMGTALRYTKRKKE